MWTDVLSMAAIRNRSASSASIGQMSPEIREEDGESDSDDAGILLADTCNCTVKVPIYLALLHS